MNKLIAAAGLSLLIAIPAQAANLTTAEIKDEIVGKRFKFETTNGFRGRTKYYTSGRAKLYWNNFEPRSDRGTWRLGKGCICNTWNVVRGGKEKCFTIKRVGKGRYVNQDGTTMKRVLF